MAAVIDHTALVCFFYGPHHRTAKPPPPLDWQTKDQRMNERRRSRRRFPVASGSSASLLSITSRRASSMDYGYRSDRPSATHGRNRRPSQSNIDRHQREIKEPDDYDTTAAANPPAFNRRGIDLDLIFFVTLDHTATAPRPATRRRRPAAPSTPTSTLSWRRDAVPPAR